MAIKLQYHRASMFFLSCSGLFLAKHTQTKQVEEAPSALAWAGSVPLLPCLLCLASVISKPDSWHSAYTPLCVSAGLSAALFAPAWVWEVGNRTDWLQRQKDFWGSIQACWELPRALVCQLPFSTCFDQGAGYARFSEVCNMFIPHSPSKSSPRKRLHYLPAL